MSSSIYRQWGGRAYLSASRLIGAAERLSVLRVERLELCLRCLGSFRQLGRVAAGLVLHLQLEEALVLLVGLHLPVLALLLQGAPRCRLLRLGHLRHRAGHHQGPRAGDSSKRTCVTVSRSDGMARVIADRVIPTQSRDHETHVMHEHM